MASRGGSKQGFIARWWHSQSERHFAIITYSTILSVASLIWGFVFLFMLGGYSDPDLEHLVPWSWLAFVGGILVAFYAAPEFFVYWGQKQLLEDILLIDSRPEVLRRRKEAEDAADMLGTKYQARLMGLYLVHNINIGKKYRVEAITPMRPHFSATSEEAISLPTDDNSWWNTTDSLLSRTLPGLHALRNPDVNRGIMITSVVFALGLAANSVLGMFRGPSGEMDHTLDLTASLYEFSAIHEPSPFYDAVSILILLVCASLVISTRPGNSPSQEEE
tara:strand:- start:1009 stop:1836 length:828 start_codon:yes stop_codon:yes gene_type:complete